MTQLVWLFRRMVACWLQGVADEIASRMPDIVAVEEASLIRTESPGDLIIGGTNPATQIVFDPLSFARAATTLNTYES